MVRKGLVRKVASGIGVGCIGLAFASGPKMNLEVYKPINKEGATARVNAFYNVGKTRGYTFGDFSTSGDYLGKTSLTRPLSEKLGLKSQIIHYNEPFTQAGIGATVGGKLFGKVYGNVSVMPGWIDKKGKLLGEKGTVGYYLSAPLPKGFSVSSFGEANVFSKEGPTWGYGEVDISKKLSEKLGVGLNFPLTSKGSGKLLPEIKTARLKAQYNF